MFGKDNKKKHLIAKLPVIFAKIQLEHHISPGDFPDCGKMQVRAGPWRRWLLGPLPRRPLQAAPRRWGQGCGAGLDFRVRRWGVMGQVRRQGRDGARLDWAVGEGAPGRTGPCSPPLLTAPPPRRSC